MKRFRSAGLFALALVTLASAPAFAADPAKVATGAKGSMLTNDSGMTLYTFDKDAGGKSACNGPCATNWPALKASADAKPTADYTMITRDDGVRQWAYKGKPLYTWAKDQKPGDTTGSGMANGAWHVAQP